MSRLLRDSEVSSKFSLGDQVSFLRNGKRLTGTVVRVYNTRTVYHVEVDGHRYEVPVQDDDPRKE